MSVSYLNSEDEPARTRVMAVINQKGGVGKTTTTANLGYQLAKKGKDVLLIDFDSQASLTNYFNVGLDNVDYYGVYEMMLKEFRDIDPEEDEFLANTSLEEMCAQFIVKPTYASAVTKKVNGVKTIAEEQVEFGVSLLPSCLMLSDYELELGKSNNYSAFHLFTVISAIIKYHEYDYILIDCNPSLGILSMNAIVAAMDGVIIPTNLDVMSTRGIVNLIDRIVDIQTALAENGVDHMGVVGIVLNLYADRRTVDQSIREDMERFYPFRIFESHIPESINAKKAALTGVTYSQMYKKADEAYAHLADEVEEQILRMQDRGPQILRVGEQMPVSALKEDGEE